MPLYETLSDKLIVVIDIGAAYTKFVTWLEIWKFCGYLTIHVVDSDLLENLPQDVSFLQKSSAKRLEQSEKLWITKMNRTYMTYLLNFYTPYISSNSFIIIVYFIWNTQTVLCIKKSVYNSG